MPFPQTDSSRLSAGFFGILNSFSFWQHSLLEFSSSCFGFFFFFLFVVFHCFWGFFFRCLFVFFVFFFWVAGVIFYFVLFCFLGSPHSPIFSSFCFFLNFHSFISFFIPYSLSALLQSVLRSLSVKSFYLLIFFEFPQNIQTYSFLKKQSKFTRLFIPPAMV